jgi:hypothetical protein
MRRGEARFVLVVCLALAGCAPSSPRAASRDRTHSANPFFSSPFTVKTNGFTFGQDPSWTADGRVLSNEVDRSGTKQVYVSHVDGSDMKCLTCGQPGPNAFPQERPQGDWILFCSWRGQQVTFGSPCLGGFGTDLYVMRPDGTDVTLLTMPGTSFEHAGVVFDNYHPSWSPDGKHVVWTHLNFVDAAAGGTQWTMLLADFVTKGGPPRLENIRVVGNGGNTAYETHVWAPDGTGFLYTLFTSAGDPAAGWLNTELYFMRLYGQGATPEHPRTTHLTDNNAGWDEQAVFTPDMRNVVWMSSRAAPTWYQMVVTAAQQTGFSPPMQNHVAGPMFVLSVLDPHFRTDLYELDLSTRAIRRLTALDSVVPEFYFDRSGTRLLWSNGIGSRSTMIGEFALASKPEAVHPSIPPDPAWTGAPRNSRASTADASGPVPASPGPTFNARSIPPEVLDGLTLLQSQLTQLAAQLKGLPQGASCCHSPAG